MRAGSGQYSIEKKFVKYVSQNILSMLAISAYILADTFFIARGEGANGITALNLALPVYSFIFAIGALIGTGSAIKFNILRSRGENGADGYFSNAVFFTLLFSLVFVGIGLFAPDKLVMLLGGRGEVLPLGTSYARIFLLFTPFFMWNNVWTAFVRNDGNPSLVMAATLLSNAFNIIMDYVLMFPMGLGMAGAALATAVSPVVSIAVCSLHFLKKNNTIRFRLPVSSGSGTGGRRMFSVRMLAQSCQLGISAFVAEMSSGVTTMIFNFLILGLTGNDGVAAYGIVANLALVAAAIFNGIAQGAQPLLSNFYGKGETKAVKKVLQMSIGTAMIITVLIILATNLFTGSIVEIFNSEGNKIMETLATKGVRLYFTGFLFAGFNIVGAGYLSATESAGWAFMVSVLRGFIAISVCAMVMAALFGMTGVWLAFAAAELITSVVMIIAIRKK